MWHPIISIDIEIIGTPIQHEVEKVAITLEKTVVMKIYFKPIEVPSLTSENHQERMEYFGWRKI